MMSKKNIWILILLIIGIGGIIAIEGYAKPKAREQAAQYEAEQKSPYTHDISRSLKFRSKYMGNAGNIINLNNSLPYSDMNNTFQLYPDELTAELKYKVLSAELETAKLQEMLLYVATANFVMIDNLQALRLTFEDAVFTIQRKTVEEWYGGEGSLVLLQNKQNWRELVQDKMKDREFTQKFNDQLVKREAVQ
ncbi:protein of unknown function [Paenibacillus uliginis N3/975]|uniref:DUF4825 domain-containing protein n=1 Tax=Paenibacillus uliginis N3/975 TaxID=1313296 RepID=A0A1X7GWL5_9BACL|nr:DUF4825 domain-containing protein [Paenibacillus uliginis]SMF75696.1 protein of unknown function [Paenibacillus uliginis N3/975]